MILGHLALVAAALFASAAFYVNFAEQPARLALDDRAALLQWQRSYARAALMQVHNATVPAAISASSPTVSRLAAGTALSKTCSA